MDNYCGRSVNQAVSNINKEISLNIDSSIDYNQSTFDRS